MNIFKKVFKTIPINNYPFKNASRPLNIAHRGSKTLWPENTIYAYSRALDVGADVLELDVRLSADGEVVVIHDAEVDRISEASGRVDEMTLEELKSLQLHSNVLEKNNIHILGLKDVFESFPQAYFSIDIKSPSNILALKVINIIRQMYMTEKVVLASFHGKVSVFLRERVPDISRAASAKEIHKLFLLSRLGLPACSRADVYVVPLKRGNTIIATKALIKNAHEQGREVYTWTIDDEERMRSLLEIGIDGIITNRPDLLSGLLEDYKN